MPEQVVRDKSFVVGVQSVAKSVRDQENWRWGGEIDDGDETESPRMSSARLAMQLPTEPNFRLMRMLEKIAGRDQDMHLKASARRYLLISVALSIATLGAAISGPEIGRAVAVVLGIAAFGSLMMYARTDSSTQEPSALSKILNVVRECLSNETA